MGSKHVMSVSKPERGMQEWAACLWSEVKVGLTNTLQYFLGYMHVCAHLHTNSCSELHFQRDELSESATTHAIPKVREENTAFNVFHLFYMDWQQKAKVSSKFFKSAHRMFFTQNGRWGVCCKVLISLRPGNWRWFTHRPTMSFCRFLLSSFIVDPYKFTSVHFSFQTISDYMGGCKRKHIFMKMLKDS